MLREEVDTKVLLAKHHAAFQAHVDAWFSRQESFFEELVDQQKRLEEAIQKMQKGDIRSTIPQTRPSTATLRRSEVSAAGSPRKTTVGNVAAIKTPKQHFGKDFLQEGSIQRGQKGSGLQDDHHDHHRSALHGMISTRRRSGARSRTWREALSQCLPEKPMWLTRMIEVFWARGLKWITYFFDYLCAGLILANAVLIGAETEYQAVHGTENRSLEFIQTALNCFFVGELILRIFIAGGPGTFFSGRDRGFNAFDACLVFTSVIDMVLEALKASYGARTLMMGRIFRAFRLLRAVRMLRIVRSLRYIREFRKLVFSLSGSMHTLFWSLLLLMFILYIAAICLTQGVSNYIYESAPGEILNQEQLQARYGGLLVTMYSLFQAVTGGIDWDIIIEPLFGINWILGAAFLTFAAVTIFGVLNIITSVFVESAVQSQQYYRDLLIQDQMQRKETYVEHVRNIFKSLDEDNSGFITMDEMQKIFDSAQMQTYLEALEIEAGDARTLFKLLDRDDSELVDIDEFCDGCLRLRGQAKSFDIFCMIFESERQLNKLGHFMGFVEDQFNALKGMNVSIEKATNGLERRSFHRERPPLPVTVLRGGSPFFSHRPGCKATKLLEQLKGDKDGAVEPPLDVHGWPDGGSASGTDETVDTPALI